MMVSFLFSMPIRYKLDNSWSAIFSMYLSVSTLKALLLSIQCFKRHKNICSSKFPPFSMITNVQTITKFKRKTSCQNPLLFLVHFLSVTDLFIYDSPSVQINLCIGIYLYICFYLTIHHHHHVVPPARISLTLSRHFSLSFITSGRSSGLHPVSSHSCCM